MHFGLNLCILNPVNSVLLEEQLPQGIRLTTCQHVPDYGTGCGGKVDGVSNEQLVGALDIDCNHVAFPE